MQRSVFSIITHEIKNIHHRKLKNILPARGLVLRASTL